MRDSEIEQHVLRNLRLYSASAREICVESEGGVVTLSGTVPDNRESLGVFFATRRAPGVRAVINRIEVKDNNLQIPEHSWDEPASATAGEFYVSSAWIRATL